MELEKSIINSNKFYLEQSIAYIYKKHTPIKVISVEKNQINKAFFSSSSTLDFVGVYKGKYIEFEAKSTRQTSSFPIKNILKHQFDDMQIIQHFLGICFLIIEFSTLNKYFLCPYEKIKDYINISKRKSIKYEWFIKNCGEINQSYYPRLNYLAEVDKFFDL